MRRPTNPRTRATLLAVAVLAPLATTGCGPEAAPITVLAGSHTDIVDFTITAQSVKNLHPGAVKRLTLTLANPYRFDLKVLSLRGDLASTSDRRCRPTATNLVVREYEGRLPLTVSAGQRRTVGGIPLYMPNSVADGCQRVTFTIRLSGVATKGSR